MYPITIGRFLPRSVLSTSTAFSPVGSEVDVATGVVDVATGVVEFAAGVVEVGVTSSHSNESHGQPQRQFS